MRRHPVILGLILLAVIGLASFFLLFGIMFYEGDGGGLTAVGEKIGVVSVTGAIIDSKTVVDQINKCADDTTIKAILVRIDSPGGGVAASQEIYESILSAKKKKHVVASLGSVAASGGYYVACATDKIVSNPGTVTGSIGAIMHFTDVEETLKKIGIRASTVKSGTYKDIGTPLREMTKSERELIQGVIDDIYDQFIEAVSVNRKIPVAVLKEYCDGRIFTGRQAYKLGLIDELGDMDAAAHLAAKLAGIKGKPELVYSKEKGLTFWKYLIEETKSTIVGQLRQELTGSLYMSNAWRAEY